jgi:pilus assembly protein CpaB
MRWSIVILLVLGLMAATAAGLLATTWHARSAPAVIAGSPGEAQVVVAARPLEANSVIQADVVAVRSVPRAQAPRGCLGDPALAIGKSLRLPMAQGQLFTAASFVPEESPRNLANRMLAPGQRAKTVSLPEDAAMEGLLYPGCMVDVLWSFKGEESKSEAMSKTLLENVPVLAIGRHTILAEDAGDSAENASSRGGSTRQLVTLLLDPRQAATLQLAMDHGTISLALRNPTDAIREQSQAVPLRTLVHGYLPELDNWNAAGWAQGLRDLSKAIGAGMAGTGADPAPVAQTPARHGWETVVIRGAKVQVEQLADAAGGGEQ